MLYKFKSRSTADLILLEPQGRRLLQIVGKEPGPKSTARWPHQRLGGSHSKNALMP